MAQILGNGTIKFEKRISVLGYAAVVGKKEGEGPLGHEFDDVYNDAYLGLKSFEDAESKLMENAVLIATKKSGLKPQDIGAIFAGDLLNQCIASTFGLSSFGVNLIGMYGACSTMALTLANASVFLDSGAIKRAVCTVSSHFCTAERQYRFPLEYGSQRTPSAQWTVTGSGAAVLGKEKGNAPYISKVTFGKPVDFQIKDANNMGAAMAPAAYSTIKQFLSDTETSPLEYDAIFTGDLGLVGSDLLIELAEKDGIDLKAKHKDCGVMIFDTKTQDVHSGGSGCGCSASVLCSHILNKLCFKEYKNILFCATGALLSPTSSLQGKSIPCIAHLVNIRND